MNHFLIYLYFPNIIIRSIKFLFDVAVIGFWSWRGYNLFAYFLNLVLKQFYLRTGPSSPPDSEFTFSLEEIITKYRNGGVTSALGNPSVQYAEGAMPWWW